MKGRMSLLVTILAFASFFAYVSLESVPALLWSNQAGSFHSDSHHNTLVDQIESNDLLGFYLKHKVPIVAFVQNDLNVEQFAANDAPFVSSIFDNSQLNPAFFANVKNSRKVFSLFKNDDFIENENTVIYLTGKNLKENDETIKYNTEKFNSSGPVVFMLTGEHNELLKVNKRSRRATKEDSTAVFLQYPDTNPCFLVSIASASLTLINEKDIPEEPRRFISPKIDPATTSCSSEATKGEKLTLTFTEDTSSNPVTLTSTWVFDTKNGTNWKVNSVSVTSTLGNFESKNLLIYAANIFSYSCQKTTVSLVKDTKTATITFEAFQVQPFFISNDQKTIKFETSSDCAVWFTLPIWSGLIVILVLITILYFGIIALMSISTPDRFENPKGRGLIITNFDE